jgi:non-heme chloroperoxidase
MTSAESSAKTITEHELEQCERANQTDRTPVVFVHGLWLLPSSWDRWATLFEDNGYVALTPGWPDDPDTVQAAAAHPETFAHKTIGQIADHFAAIIGGLTSKPAVIGHSFGGLLTQILAGRGLARVSVAIDPAPFRGVLPLPISALKSALPVLRNPANRNRAVPLTYDQFRYAFANVVGEDEAKQLYATYAVPGSGAPLFEPRRPTSTRGPRRRSTPTTPTVGRCCSSRASRTTRSRGRSPTRPTGSSRTTRA